MQNFLLYATTVLIWGSTWFAITFQIGDIHPLLSIAYRFALAAAILFVLCLITGKLKNMRFTRKQHGFIALMGLFQFCLNYWVFYIATGYLTSGLVAVCFSSMIVLNSVNQAIFFKIPIKRQIMLGASLGLGGMVMVFWPEITALSLENEIVIGLILALTASYIASLGNMASYWISSNGLPILLTTCYGMAYGTIMSFALAFASGAELAFDTGIEYVGSLVFLALFGSAIAFWCYLTVLRNIGADKAAYATVMFPIVALIISTFFEGYVWTTLAIAGMGLVVIGNVIAMANSQRLRKWVAAKKGV